MITFEVNDMTCKHCIATITQAVASVDRQADVRIDLASHRVEIESSTASAEALSRCIRDAGYSPSIANSTAVATAPKKGGCCCG
jgi:copper chaperone